MTVTVNIIIRQQAPMRLKQSLKNNIDQSVPTGALKNNKEIYLN
jgi:hypothetical protein